VIADDRANYHFRVRVNTPPTTFDPKPGTVNRKGGTCTLTGVADAIRPYPIRGQGRRMSCRLMAIAAKAERGRLFLDPIESHEHTGTATHSVGDQKARCRRSIVISKHQCTA